MKPTCLALLCAALWATPLCAQEQQLVDGSKVDVILGIAKSYGEARLETQHNGDPRIAGVIDGLAYQIFFMNCTAHADCEDLNFYAGFRGIKPTMDALNAWNRDKRFGNAYLDADLDAVIEFDLNLDHGVSRGNLDAGFGLWSLLVAQFAAYVGYEAPGE